MPVAIAEASLTRAEARVGSRWTSSVASAACTRARGGGRGGAQDAQGFLADGHELGVAGEPGGHEPVLEHAGGCEREAFGVTLLPCRRCRPS